MDFIKKPMEIENRSMEIIAPHLQGLNLNEDQVKVYSRIIHAAGDVEYAPIIRLHPELIESARKALEKGCNIYTDVEMVRTGINKRKLAAAKTGNQYSEMIAKVAKEQGITRSMAAMRSFGQDMNGAIIAIGNAPTALFEVLRMVEEENLRPAAIVGIPVGFVGAADSKAELAANTLVPYAIVEGTKGGSPIAAAVVNAIMYIIDNNRD